MNQHQLDKQLIQAASDGNLPDVEDAIQRGAQVNDNYFGASALNFACQKGHLPVVQSLLTKHSANLEATSISMHTPLHAACDGGHLEIVRCLLSHNANRNARDDRDETPLHIACRKGRLEVVQHLLVEASSNSSNNSNNDTDANSLLLLMLARNDEGKTPLQVAYENKQNNVMAYIESLK